MEKIGQILLDTNLLLLLINEEQYTSQIREIAKSVEKTKNTICYVCLSRTYKDVVDEFKENGIDTRRFIFIDTLSSHYGLPKPEKKCIFLNSPDDLESIKKAIEELIEKEKCSVLLFDTISALLIYQKTFSILKFTHSLTTEKNKEHLKKLFIVLKNGTVPEKEHIELVNDLQMFADRTLDLSESGAKKKPG